MISCNNCSVICQNYAINSNKCSPINSVLLNILCVWILFRTLAVILVSDLFIANEDNFSVIQVECLMPQCLAPYKTTGCT